MLKVKNPTMLKIPQTVRQEPTEVSVILYHQRLDKLSLKCKYKAQ